MPTIWRTRLALLVTVVVLGAVAWRIPQLRRDLVRAIVKLDARPSEPPVLPGGEGAGLDKAARVRVVLVDGLSEAMAQTLPAWSAACQRGVAVRVDVGFPTVSLPVEAQLWTGLTQQQSGIVYRADAPIVPPLAHSIPAQVPGSIAIAESHGWIVRSLGFATAEPLVDPAKPPVRDADPTGWKTRWEARALEAVTSPSPLVFVHVLRVDDAGHKHRGDSAEYKVAAQQADAILARLMAADPMARWFLLSDHGHRAAGGHGGEERHVRQVQHCIVGPGIAPARGDLVHGVDIARAIADSTGTKLDAASRGRPLGRALATPLAEDQAIPPLPLSQGAGALFILAAGLAVASWSVRRWWLAPWWFVAAAVSLVVMRGEPSLSTGMIYKPEGRDMYLTWLPALALATIATYLALGRTTLLRTLAAQLGLPLAVAAALVTASGAWATVFGAAVAPVVPRYTAYMSPALLVTAHGLAAVALAALARLVRPPSDRSAPPAPRPSVPSAAP